MDRELKLEQLIDGAEELLTKLADAHDPRIQTLRDRVDHAVRDARRYIAQRGDAMEWSDVAGAVDDYVCDHPWLAVACGSLIAGTMAFLAGVTLGARKR